MATTSAADAMIKAILFFILTLAKNYVIISAPTEGRGELFPSI
jgi:hypothetical protein